MMRMASRYLSGFVVLAAPLLGLASPVTVAFRGAGGAPVANVVAVFDAVDGRSAPAAGSAVIDQVNRQFTPRVSVVRTGTAISFPNSDRIRHQVYSFSPAKTFNLKLYAGSTQPPVLFDRPGLVVLGCNIHDTMIAFVAVVDTPWFGKSASDGNLRLDLPPGRYRLRVWHPDLATPTPPQVVTIGAAPATFTPAPDIAAAPAGVAAWPE